MSNSNSFITSLTVENFKLKSIGLKVAAIGGFVILGTIVIMLIKVIYMKGISNFGIPKLGGGYLILLWALAVLTGIGYLSLILWKKSLAVDAVVREQSADNLTQVLELQKQFYQTLAMMILGSYAFIALISLLT